MENEKQIRCGLQRLQGICKNISAWQQSILAVQDRLMYINKNLTQEIKRANEDIDVLNILLDRENAEENKSGENKDKGTVHKD